MKRLLLLLLCTPCLAQAPNMVPACGQYCVLDSSSNPTAVYQYGDGAKLWGNTFTNPTLPLVVNYTNPALLGIPSTWSGPLPTTLYVQQTNVVQTIKVHNLDPSSWTVTVPALPTPPPAVTSALSATVATTQAVTTITTTSPVVPAQSRSCTIGRNGGTCTISFPQLTLAPLTATLPNSSPATYTFTCTLPTGTAIAVAADGTVVIPPLACTAVKQ